MMNLSDPHLDIKELLIETEGVIILSGTIHGLFGKLFEKGRLKKFQNFIKLFQKNLMIDFT